MNLYGRIFTASTCFVAVVFISQIKLIQIRETNSNVKLSFKNIKFKIILLHLSKGIFQMEFY